MRGEGMMLHLYQVNMKDRETGAKICLKVPAVNVDEATRKVVSMGFLGLTGPYIWEGSGPLYDGKGNRVISA